MEEEEGDEVELEEGDSSAGGGEVDRSTVGVSGIRSL